MILDFVKAGINAIQFHFARWWREYLVLLAALLVLAGIVCYLFAPPKDFPRSSTAVIPEGATLPEIAELLAKQHIIAHPNLFANLVRVLGGDRTLHAGPYFFAEPESAFSISLRLIQGDSGIDPLKLTFPEGLSVREMSEVLDSKLPLVSETSFETAAQKYEGYLFPDTYYFSPHETADSIVETLRNTFRSKIGDLTDDIENSGHSLDDIVTMASLIEKEANNPTDRRIISGILWRRLSMNMALQVDAVFGYIRGIGIYHPTLDDLKIESPYNTYLHTGLPPTPIGNPGLDSIVAAIEPTKTNYLYYLTGKDGKTYYATTFAGHQSNREKYLK